jgi:hypothetical protein
LPLSARRLPNPPHPHVARLVRGASRLRPTNYVRRSRHDSPTLRILTSLVSSAARPGFDRRTSFAALGTTTPQPSASRSAVASRRVMGHTGVARLWGWSPDLSSLRVARRFVACADPRRPTAAPSSPRSGGRRHRPGARAGGSGGQRSAASTRRSWSAKWWNCADGVGIGSNRMTHGIRSITSHSRVFLNIGGCSRARRAPGSRTEGHAKRAPFQASWLYSCLDRVVSQGDHGSCIYVKAC